MTFTRIGAGVGKISQNCGWMWMPKRGEAWVCKNSHKKQHLQRYVSYGSFPLLEYLQTSKLASDLLQSRDNLEILSRVRKLLKRALTHENFLKIELKINKYEKKDTVFLKMENEMSKYLMLN